MALTNFFRINLPYGIARNENGAWMAFNREYMPLGCNQNSNWQSEHTDFVDHPLHTKYDKLSEKLLLELADSETEVVRNEEGEIVKIWFYSDATNPTSIGQDTERNWNRYFEKLKKVSKLKVRNPLDYVV